MKKLLIPAVCLFMAVALMSADKKEDVMKKENGTYVVNTTTLGKDVVGYEGPTPLKVYIKSDKIQKIEFLANQETPRYWKRMVDFIEHKWDGMKVQDAKTTIVDGCTGATYSSDAVKANVKLAVEYYLKNK